MLNVQLQPETTVAPIVLQEEDARGGVEVGAASSGTTLIVSTRGEVREFSYRLASQEGVENTSVEEEPPIPHRVGLPKIAPANYEQILAEREGLLRKKYGDGLSSLDERRLRYLQWQVSTVEDSQIEDDLDRLESLVDRIESAARRVDDGMKRFKAPFPTAFRPRSSR